MPKNSNISHTVFFDTVEEKEKFQNWLRHLKYKTGDNCGVIVNKALMFYNMELNDSKKN